MGSSSKAKARRPGTSISPMLAIFTHLDLPWCLGGGGGGGGSTRMMQMVRSGKKLP